MRIVRRLTMAGALVAGMVAVPAGAQAQTFEIIGQVGMTVAQYTGNSVSSGSEAQVSGGVKGRVGGFVYVDGGIFWTRSGGSIDGESLTISSVRFPVTVGLRILRARIIDLRIFGGAAINSVRSVSSDSGLEKSDLKSSNWAGRVGAGVDIALFAVDLGYEFGASDIFEGSELSGIKQNAWVLEAGLRFGF